jgi:hypothetical protein
MTVHSKFKRVIFRILKWVGVTLLIAIVTGIIYEELGRRQDRKRLPQIGQSVDIGGRSLNIYCSGGRQIIVKDSHHAISDEAPDAVINAVRDVVTLAREDGSRSSATPRGRKNSERD